MDMYFEKLLMNIKQNSKLGNRKERKRRRKPRECGEKKNDGQRINKNHCGVKENHCTVEGP